MTLAEIHEQTLAGLGEHLKRSQDALSDRWDPKLANEMANLARSVATLTAEIRKREAHSRKMVGDMSEDERQVLVKAYIASLTKARREEFLKYLKDLDETSGR